ncbi:uncharacterized protein BO72DRAFT_443449 [Aspergillus fijiensis CBS 313.89]|uniref:Uncharacterized protein n=1 Tax=Aspergillus fijiensis CBS 313.89 TaxID=1448319 RepID=A0A8G1W3M6_9EURO|nr:uncharacterized protein BO72DRAFT_443449 [Aspergillus fijiensis CBS 313.89]RAK82607.1 hypothetical protein BO72DRAFT_443449 [Aspergillus fijiensis CBS 313.89]
MLKPRNHSHLLVSRRRLDRRPVSCHIKLRRHVDLRAKQRSPYPEATPSQTLRFALTATLKRPEHDSSNPILESHLSQILQNKWPTFSLPSPLLATLWPDPERHAPKASRLDTSQIRSLPDLQDFVESNVINKEGCRLLQSRQCVPLSKALALCERHNQFREVLSAIHGIITRVERINGHCSKRLYVLGMYYAALAFSVPALKRYLEGYLACGSQRLGPNESRLLVHALLDASRYLAFCEETRDMGAMIGLVTGDAQPSNNRLHDILYWAGPGHRNSWSGSYFTLLVKFNSKALQKALWARLIDDLSPESHKNQFQAVYTCVEALIDAGDTQRAITFLNQISERANNTLPFFSTAKSLCYALPADKLQASLIGEVEHTEILNQLLTDMENRLGIRWQSNLLLHSSASEPLTVASEQPLLTIDGDSTGYESVERLLTQIHSFGCSKSKADLGQIADSLNEHDGRLLSSLAIADADTNMEYAWCPQNAPLEFPESLSSIRTDFSKPWTPSTLGLLRVSPDPSGQCLAGKRSLHLMQLGYLVARPRMPQGRNSQDATNWKQTGHIIAWDRFHGQLVAVFVGPVHGASQHCIEAGPSNLRFGLNSILSVNLFNDRPTHCSSNRVTPIGSGATRYYVDVDPSPDLLP